MSCSHCMRTGHVRADCYRLIGFSDDFQFTKSTNYQPTIKGNAVVARQDNEEKSNTCSEATMSNQNQFFSKEQVSELVNIIKQVQIGSVGTTTSEINANVVAGTILKYTGTCLAIFNTKTWIIDSGVSEHMCFDTSSFLTLTPLPAPLHISLTNSFQLCVTHIGNVSIQPDMILDRVPLMRRGQVFGEVRDGLYLFQPPRIEYVSSFRKDVVSIQKGRNFSVISTSISFPVSLVTTVTSNVKQWPFKTVTYNGYTYFLTIVDDYSRATWTFLLSSKGNAFSVLKSFLSMVDRQFNLKVKKIRSDNAMELGKGSLEAIFLESQGILHENSSVATPQQNGVVERKHRHLLEVARSLLFHSKVPLQYWGECVLTATYLINRIPSKVLHGLTPYEKLLGKQPSYDSLKSFGCLCYVSTLSHNRGKFEPRAKGCIFLCYAQNQKSYKILDLDTKRVFISRDVKFHEHLFPFTHSPSSPVFSFFPLGKTPSDASPHTSTKHTPRTPSSSSPTLHSPQFILSSPSSSSQVPAPSTPSNITLTSSESNPSYSPILSRSLSHSPTSTPIPIPPPPVRKYDRVTQKPAYLNDYICNIIYLSDLSSCLSKPLKPTAFSFNALSMKNQHLLTSISSISEPRSYLQVSTHPGWKKAMDAEISALELNHTWDIREESFIL
uniref:Uncharacterized protein LOC104236139 n=1 Tax=Nicotiana sylvestris TaxID=4096 RepID=A0A1U7XPA5_NICSY|nr:PREDICTED: uncharacterized protein LOC104236139 [Nicotiana sylvestris]